MFVKFKLAGLSAFLFHADDVEQGDLLKEWRDDPDNKPISVRGDDRSPPWTWQTYLYHDGKHLVCPADNVMVCLRQAGAQIIMNRQKTFKEASQSGILPDSEFFEFRCKGKQISMEAIRALRDKPFKAHADAAREMGFSLFMKRARVGQAKHVRVRARFDDWAIHGRVEVILPEITPAVIEKLFEIAGRVGLADWRPGCKTPGPFGRFGSKLTFEGIEE